MRRPIRQGRQRAFRPLRVPAGKEQQRARRGGRTLLCRFYCRSDDLDLGRLRALCALLDDKLHALAFAQRLEAAGANLGEMREQILAAVLGRDESETFSVVEPLDG